MEKNYTSLALSKWLAKKGCKLKTVKFWKSKQGKHYLDNNCVSKIDVGFKRADCNVYSAYDLFWDICIKYKNEFLGNTDGWHKHHLRYISERLQEGKKQEAEEYIMKYSLFNS